VTIASCDGQVHTSGARSASRPSVRPASAARRTASVSWLVSPCRARLTRPAPPQPPAIQRFAGYRSHRPEGHSTRGCAGGADTEGLTPHVRLVAQQHRPLAPDQRQRPANGQRQLAGVTVPSATDSPSTPQPPAIQRFAGYRSHRPAGHSTRGCAGGAYTEGLTPHVRLFAQQRRPLAPGQRQCPANGQRQLAGVTVPSATDSPSTPQPPAIQRFAGSRSHRPAGHSTRGCAGGAYTEGLTPHVRLAFISTPSPKNSST